MINHAIFYLQRLRHNVVVFLIGKSESPALLAHRNASFGIVLGTPVTHSIEVY